MYISPDETHRPLAAAAEWRALAMEDILYHVTWDDWVYFSQADKKARWFAIGGGQSNYVFYLLKGKGVIATASGSCWVGILPSIALIYGTGWLGWKTTSWMNKDKIWLYESHNDNITPMRISDSLREELKAYGLTKSLTFG